MARRLIIGVAVLLLAAGCSSHTAAKHEPANQEEEISVGAGPGVYKVEPQPAAGSCHYRHTASGESLPDSNCTPGAANPKVTQANIKDTICKPGFTKTIRPPVSITGKEKTANAASYSFTGDMHTAEYDHLISLELGGDPNDPRNLWVEPQDPGKTGPGTTNKKDSVESKLHTLVCSGKMQLADAQQAISGDWTTALPN